MPEDPDDLHLRGSAGVSDRVFLAFCVIGCFLALLAILSLPGCGLAYRIHATSDGTDTTGDFMIGGPHENSTTDSVERSGNPDVVDNLSR